jgi:hypothetical protein
LILVYAFARSQAARSRDPKAAYKYFFVKKYSAARGAATEVGALLGLGSGFGLGRRRKKKEEEGRRRKKKEEGKARLAAGENEEEKEGCAMLEEEEEEEGETGAERHGAEAEESGTAAED